MSPLAEKILALLADGYRVEPEDYDCRFVKDAQVMPHGHGGEVRSAVRELADAGLLETACNGSGIAWINDKGREAFGCVHQVGGDAERLDWLEGYVRSRHPGNAQISGVTMDGHGGIRGWIDALRHVAGKKS